MDFQVRSNKTNRLLAALPEQDQQQLSPLLERVTLELKQKLQEPDVVMSHIYFPISTVNSLLIIMEDGMAIEIGTVGNEGMVGLPIFLGSDSIHMQTIVQIEGDALRMPSETFKDVVRTLPSLRDILQRYTQALFMQVAQSSACNRAHDIAQRCARWLLMTHDRAGADQFMLTQEFLAHMLGVRRAGVSEIASSFQRAGLIQYSRGSMTILDRPALEARTCECYLIILREFDSIFT